MTDKYRIINKLAGGVFLIYLFYSCSSMVNHNAEYDESIMYARKWNLPDSIFLKDMYYGLIYKSYKDYCLTIENYNEKCLSQANSEKIRIITIPKIGGIHGEIEITLLEKEEKRIRVKKVDLKDKTPIFPNDSTLVDTNSIIIKELKNTFLSNDLYNEIEKILLSINFFNIPPLFIEPGVKRIGNDGQFIIEFFYKGTYHRINRDFRCEDAIWDSYTRIRNKLESES